MARWRQQRLDDVYDREIEQQRINQYMDERFEQYEQMMKQLTKRMVALIGNQNPVHPIQYYYNHHGYSDGEVSDDEEEEEYHEESLFYDTDDGEDADAVIGDEPIFDEEDEHDVEYIDFIGIDKVSYSYIPLIYILKELQVNHELVLFYAYKNKFLSQYLGKI